MVVLNYSKLVLAIVDHTKLNEVCERIAPASGIGGVLSTYARSWLALYAN